MLAGNVTFASGLGHAAHLDLTTGAADATVAGGTLNVGSVTGPVLLDVGTDTFIGSSAGDGTLHTRTGGRFPTPTVSSPTTHRPAR